MESIKLLSEARQKGLEIHANGTELVIRGPRSQERLAKILLERKHEVLIALKTEKSEPICDREKPCPYLDPNGVLVIPFDSPKRFHWWNGGQGIFATLKELEANERIIRRYVPGWNGNREQNRFEKN